MKVQYIDRHLKRFVTVSLSEREDKELLAIRAFEGRNLQTQGEWFIRSFCEIVEAETRFRLILPSDITGPFVTHGIRVDEPTHELLAAHSEESLISLSRQASAYVRLGIKFHRQINGVLPLRKEEFQRRVRDVLQNCWNQMVFESLFRH